MVGTFPVERGRKDLAAFAAADELLRSGHAVGMFPEGTRTKTGGLQRGRSGAVRLAMQAGVSVVPAAVINSKELMGGFGRWPKPELVVRFGPPVAVAGDPHDGRLVAHYTDLSMRGIAALLPPELRGVYGDEVAPQPEPTADG